MRAELDGLPSHGFSRIPFYVDQALSGKVKAQAIPLVRQPAPAAVLVDAGNGFAFPAILAGLEKAIPLARRNGVSVLGVTRRTIAAWLGCMRNGSRKRGSYH